VLINMNNFLSDEKKRYLGKAWLFFFFMVLPVYSAPDWRELESYLRKERIDDKVWTYISLHTSKDDEVFLKLFEMNVESQSISDLMYQSKKKIDIDDLEITKDFLRNDLDSFTLVQGGRVINGSYHLYYEEGINKWSETTFKYVLQLGRGI